MARWINYAILIGIIIISVIVTGLLYISYLQDSSNKWNYHELTLFNHSENNYTFTFSGDERDDMGIFARMINNINTDYPRVLFNINGVI